MLWYSMIYNHEIPCFTTSRKVIVQSYFFPCKVASFFGLAFSFLFFSAFFFLCNQESNPDHWNSIKPSNHSATEIPNEIKYLLCPSCNNIPYFTTSRKVIVQSLFPLQSCLFFWLGLFFSASFWSLLLTEAGDQNLSWPLLTAFVSIFYTGYKAFAWLCCSSNGAHLVVFGPLRSSVHGNYAMIHSGQFIDHELTSKSAD